MKKGALGWIGRYVRPQMGKIVLLAVGSGLMSLSMIGMALVSSALLDIITGKRPGDWVVQLWLMAGLLIGVAAINVLTANMRVRATGRMMMAMRQDLFSLLLTKNYVAVSQLHSGDILNRFTDDLQIVVGGAVTLLPQAISLLVELLVGMAVLFFIDPLFTGIVLGAGVVVMLCGRLYSRWFKHLHKDVQRTEGQTRSFLQECVSNIVVIKSFVNEQPIRRRLQQYQDANYRLKLRRNAVNNIASTALYLLFTGGYYAALVWGAFQISFGGMTFGTLTAFLQIIAQIRSPFQQASGLVPQYYGMVASAERLMELDALQPEERTAPPCALSETYAHMTALRLQDVVFGYEEGEEPVLSGASCCFEKGDMAAIMGPSGAGKSTLIKLLLGLVAPQSGSVSIETTEGALPLDAGTRGLFAYVPQGNMILSGTIRENITFCHDDVPPAEVEQAARDACLWDFLGTLPDGLDTVVGERGLGLSEGQIQRVAIARALLSGSPILLLDECTSALDEQTERALLENLRRLSDRTVLFISHKPAVTQMAAHVWRLRDGRILRED